ncbi:MAG: WG repeat-containing protein [Cyanobacteria bacterium TGS_CYA1]|nr:WG repeat-containing protein [Cyanobacteria bacterium TGS_CYA1]
MKKLILALALSLSSVVSVEACPPLSTYIAEREKLVNLLGPIDERGDYIVFEFDRNGNEISKTFTNNCWKDRKIPELEGNQLQVFQPEKKKIQVCCCCGEKHLKTVTLPLHGYRNSAGKIVIKPVFLQAEEFFEGRAAVSDSRDRIDHRWHFIDEQGKRTSKDYESVSHYSDGLCAVQVRDKEWIYIDKDGKQAFNENFEIAEDFSDGMASVFVGTESKVISKTGAAAFVCGEKKVGKFEHGLASFQIAPQHGHRAPSGVIDKTGKIILEAKFDYLRFLADGKIEAVNTNYDCLIEKYLLLAMYVSEFHYRKHNEEKNWKLPAPKNVDSALIQLEEIFTENFKLKFSSLNQEELRQCLPNFHNFFSESWELEKGKNPMLTSYFKSRGIVEPYRMIDEIFEQY